MPNEIRTAEKVMDSNPDSALQILKKMHPSQSLTDADRALYGIVLFQALDKSSKPLQPDSILNFSIKHYQNSNDKRHLALAYYYKALQYKRIQQFDKATLLYLKSLDLIKTEKNFILLGKIYSDLGDICSFQKDFSESLKKYQESFSNYKKANDTLNVSYKIIDIARMHFFMKEYSTARKYYKKALTESTDSCLHGQVYQEMGINFYWAKQLDSARYFFSKSLLYPYKGTNYAIRCFNLADLYFDTNQYDSAYKYASKAFKYPNTIFIQRECYRILTNTEYSRGDFKQMAKYMSKYQNYTDSVRKIENQTKTSILEDLHDTSGTISKSKKFLLILGIIILAISFLSFFIVLTLRNRAKRKQQQLEITEEKLSEKQLFLKNSLILKIEENKLLQAEAYKRANLIERENISKEIFNISLHLNDWETFKLLMNRTFNNLITVLQNKSSEINHKEIIWCCLFLLEIPTNDIIILLDCQQRSLYKMKQRLTQKLHLSTTTELEKLLHDLSNDK